MHEDIQKLGRLALLGESASRSDILKAVNAANSCFLDMMYWADRVRRLHFANKVKLCSIVPGKIGACSEDCKWCAQSAHCSAGCHKPQIIEQDEMVQAAQDAVTNKAWRLGIVNSGLGPTDQELQRVIETADRIEDDLRSDNQPLGLCASLGVLTESQARKLAGSKIRRYHHNLETSRRMFGKLVTTHSYDSRLETLRLARQFGMQICSGGLFGLGEEWEDRIDLAITLRDEVKPDTIPLNFLHALPGTPMENSEPLTPTEILTIIAMFRLVLPNVDLKVAGGREKNLRDLQSWIFTAGATSCMTGRYLTTSGRGPQEDHQMIRDLGMEIVNEF